MFVRQTKTFCSVAIRMATVALGFDWEGSNVTRFPTVYDWCDCELCQLWYPDNYQMESTESWEERTRITLFDGTRQTRQHHWPHAIITQTDRSADKSCWQSEQRLVIIIIDCYLFAKCRPRSLVMRTSLAPRHLWRDGPQWPSMPPIIARMVFLASKCHS